MDLKPPSHGRAPFLSRFWELGWLVFDALVMIFRVLIRSVVMFIMALLPEPSDSRWRAVADHFN
jgi:hypothetical protein